jgi:SAM-dependent methyltransferase
MDFVRSQFANSPKFTSEMSKIKKKMQGKIHHLALPHRFHSSISQGHGGNHSVHPIPTKPTLQVSALSENEQETTHHHKPEIEHKEAEFEKLPVELLETSPIQSRRMKRRVPDRINLMIAKDPTLRNITLNLIRDTLKVITSLRFGTPWYHEVRSLDRDDWDKHIAEVTDPTVVIPSWFRLPIHGILGGNDLIQAKEQAPAMSAMAALFGHEIGMRDVRYPHLEAFAPRLPDKPRILDVGCGTGDSMRALQAHYPDGILTGIDLSPEMLAVGKVRNMDKSFEFLHRAGEDMRFPDDTFDLVHESAVAHEVPKYESIKRFQESFRVLKPGALFFFLDQDPHSPIIQRQLTSGPLGVYIEPHIRSYCQMNLLHELKKIGFVKVERKKLDPNSTLVVYVGWKPKA